MSYGVVLSQPDPNRLVVDFRDVDVGTISHRRELISLPEIVNITSDMRVQHASFQILGASPFSRTWIALGSEGETQPGVHHFDDAPHSFSNILPPVLVFPLVAHHQMACGVPGRRAHGPLKLNVASDYWEQNARVRVNGRVVLVRDG